MPMSFPDMKSLQRAAQVWKFRGPEHGESEDAFREALADFVQVKDSVEAMEIRTGKGWDSWDKSQEQDAMRRAAFQGPPGTLKVIDERRG
jgi:hypothetical protein